MSEIGKRIGHWVSEVSNSSSCTWKWSKNINWLAIDLPQAPCQTHPIPDKRAFIIVLGDSLYKAQTHWPQVQVEWMIAGERFDMSSFSLANEGEWALSQTCIVWHECLSLCLACSLQYESGKQSSRIKRIRQKRTHPRNGKVEANQESGNRRRIVLYIENPCWSRNYSLHYPSSIVQFCPWVNEMDTSFANKAWLVWIFTL
jgi:hypothetical protein